MKRFLKAFLLLSAIVLLFQFLDILVYRWAEGTDNQAFLVKMLSLVGFCVPMLLIFRLFKDMSPYGGLPFLICYCLNSYFTFRDPDNQHLWLWVLLNILIVFATTCWAFFNSRKSEKKHLQEVESYMKNATAFLRQFKTANIRQYFVISGIDTKTCFIIIDIIRNKDLLYLLPDGRKLAILRRHQKLTAFEEILDDFRCDAKSDLDVLGYNENAETASYRMEIADAEYHHQIFEKGKSSYIPFDFSLLEEAQPIYPWDYFGDAKSS